MKKIQINVFIVVKNINNIRLKYKNHSPLYIIILVFIISLNFKTIEV